MVLAGRMALFKSLAARMLEKNSAYYRSPSTRIYSDFSTYAQSPAGHLARANAKAFYARASAHPRPRFDVLEVGVGGGAFALGFLQELGRQDARERTDVLSTIHYHLADFSPPLLSSARAALGQSQATFGVHTHLLDASQNAGTISESLSGLRLDLIRCNELFSDLPADLYRFDPSQGLQAARLDEQMKMRIEAAPAAALQDWEQALLRAMPAGCLIPVSQIAARAARSLVRMLRKGGHLDLFDYGFYHRSDFDMPCAIWNSSIVRQYGAQWTVDLNFLHLAAFLRADGFAPVVERQKAYVEAIERQPMAWGAQDGLDYSSAKTGRRAGLPSLQEEDYFYHLGVRA